MSRTHFFTRKYIHATNTENEIDEINREFSYGFQFLRKYPRSVTIYGSARTTPDSPDWHMAEMLARRITTDLKYTIITGGGPGIMEAASKGATEAGGQAVGICITLPSEQNSNPYTTDRIELKYFFIRKTLLSFSAEAYVFFPGGFGTFDELFSTLTLIQTRKIPSVPVILFGSSFWRNLLPFLEHEMVKSRNLIAAYDLEIFRITDDINHVISIIHKAPVSDWWEEVS